MGLRNEIVATVLLLALLYAFPKDRQSRRSSGRIGVIWLASVTFVRRSRARE